jgi:hypothetical protein
MRAMIARVQLKKIAGRDSQGAWRQEELIVGKLSGQSRCRALRRQLEE